MAAHAAGRHAEAEAAYRAVLTRSPGHAVATHLLGVALLQTGRAAEAVPHLESAAAAAGSPAAWRQPLADAHAAVATLLADAGRWDDAAAALRRAVDWGPTDPAVCLNNLAAVHLRRDDPAAAVEAAGVALARRPGYPAAVANLAAAHVGLGLRSLAGDDPPAAADHFRRAVAVDPRHADAWANLALALSRGGDPEPALAAQRAAVGLAPHDAALHSTLVALLNYTRGADPPAVLDEARRWAGRHGGTAARPAGRSVDGRPLRVGLLSPDFHRHAVAAFLSPVLAGHDPARVTIACYANVAAADDVTGRMRHDADLWRDVAGLSDDAVAERVRADGVDVLLDLCGHLVDNRLPVLARRPAAVQGVWLGYPNTTGMGGVDVRLTDAAADPPGADRFYAERLVRLPDAFFVYGPPTAAPAVSPLPMAAAGHVTFASLNNVAKLTPGVLDLWGQIMAAVPDARLVVAGVAAAVGPRVRGWLADRGVAGSRVECVGRLSHADYLALHGRVDVALDAFPWAGHRTTCDALHMGVPTVTRAGPTAVSRAGVSALTPLGLAAEWVAATPVDYVGAAVAWAGRAGELAALRAGLRSRLAASSLCDVPRFLGHWEAALRAARRP